MERNHQEEPKTQVVQTQVPAELVDTLREILARLDAIETLLEQERMSRLNSAVEGLSDQQKRVLFLRMEGLRYPEIASTLGNVERV